MVSSGRVLVRTAGTTPHVCMLHRTQVHDLGYICFQIERAKAKEETNALTAAAANQATCLKDTRVCAALHFMQTLRNYVCSGQLVRSL